MLSVSFDTGSIFYPETFFVSGTFSVRQRADHRMISSVRNTAAQAAMATVNRSPLIRAAMTATMSAARPDQTEPVAVRIAGKVMTDSVTYGT